LPQGVVAVDERRSGSVAHYPNVGARIDATALDLLHVLRQPEHAVGVPASRVSFGHQTRHLTCVLRGNPHGQQRSSDERDDLSYLNARLARRRLGSFTHHRTLCSAVNFRRDIGKLVVSSGLWEMYMAPLTANNQRP